jgi:hypothetical protein
MRVSPLETSASVRATTAPSSSQCRRLSFASQAANTASPHGSRRMVRAINPPPSRSVTFRVLPPPVPVPHRRAPLTAPPAGTERGGLGEQRMAVMSSSYWGVMCAGRILWAVLSRFVTSTWPMLFFDIIVCLISTAFLLGCNAAPPAAFEPMLWISATGLGLGVASGLPCVYSLPPEAQVRKRKPPLPLERPKSGHAHPGTLRRSADLGGCCARRCR